MLAEGTSRTIINGAIWTPKRMRTGQRLSREDDVCVRCNENIIESLGHKYWHCKRWHKTRCECNLEIVKEENWPRCLTRNTICPANCTIQRNVARNIQMMMVGVTPAIANSKQTNAQYNIAWKNCKDCSSTNQSMLRNDLQGSLSGKGMGTSHKTLQTFDNTTQMQLALSFAQAPQANEKWRCHDHVCVVILLSQWATN